MPHFAAGLTNNTLCSIACYMQVDKVEILFTKQELKEMQKYAEIEKKSAIGALCD